ncbi:MAG: hypothetical protein ACI4QP_06370, partial [Candidatus Enteromonas sp.]
HTVQPMYDEIVKPSSMYADLIVNNDGVENLAIDVLACVFTDQLNQANAGKSIGRKQKEEFGEEALAAVFSKQ